MTQGWVKGGVFLLGDLCHEEEEEEGGGGGGGGGGEEGVMAAGGSGAVSNARKKRRMGRARPCHCNKLNFDIEANNKQPLCVRASGGLQKEQ